MELTSVICPTCFEAFEVVIPSFAELPCEIDYDCEVCCSPMFISFDRDGLACAISHDE